MRHGEGKRGKRNEEETRSDLHGVFLWTGRPAPGAPQPSL
jgi:hypothetical protein